MRVVVQQVESCKVYFNGSIIRCINKGVILYIGIQKGDKLEQLKCNLDSLFCYKNSLFQQGDILLLSQFTLYADLKKNKPGFHTAESNERARELFFLLTEYVKFRYKKNIQVGLFGEYFFIWYIGKFFNTHYVDFNDDNLCDLNIGHCSF